MPTWIIRSAAALVSLFAWAACLISFSLSVVRSLRGNNQPESYSGLPVISVFAGGRSVKTPLLLVSSSRLYGPGGDPLNEELHAEAKHDQLRQGCEDVSRRLHPDIWAATEFSNLWVVLLQRQDQRLLAL